MENEEYKMTFTEAVARLHKRITFKGRATRSEFWYAWIFISLVSAAQKAVIRMLESPYASDEASIVVILFGVAFSIYTIFLFLTGWCLDIRRFHDVGLSGWWTLVPPALVAVTIIAAIGDAKLPTALFGILWLVSLIARLVIVCLDSKKGRNKYGDSEKYPEESPAVQDAGTPPDTNFSLKP